MTPLCLPAGPVVLFNSRGPRKWTTYLLALYKTAISPKPQEFEKSIRLSSEAKCAMTSCFSCLGENVLLTQILGLFETGLNIRSQRRSRIHEEPMRRPWSWAGGKDL